MALYSIQKNILKSVNARDFKLERDMQVLLEENLEEVFGLKFVSTEFQLHNLRVDTLAYDEESNSFVIIEYKRDKSSSVVDQGYAYLSLALNNKADFILEYNEKTGQTLSKQTVDWSATRVIFVAARFTTHQLGAINFQDLPIELWKVRLYDGDLLSVEQQIADSNAESIKTISKKSTSSDVVKKEIKTFSVDDLVPPDYPMREEFEKLSQAILDLDVDIRETAKSAYINYWYKHKAFAYLHPRKERLIVDLNRTLPEDLDDPKGMVRYLEKSMAYKNRNVSQISIRKSSDIPYAISIIEQVYENTKKLF
ncbi:hypothetical protein KC960_04300 [Candidatus Saccharibacteria bacterium]|nr:hypothetical protein [Candidatus Saccharibacteria bacterium]